MLLLSSGGWELLLFLTTVTWFVHPYFSGYLHLYDYLEEHLFTPYREKINGFLHQMHLMFWKAVSLSVQYVLYFIDRYLIQYYQIVCICVFHNK